jgi:hypothetical protein
VQGEDRISYSKQIKSAQQEVGGDGRRKGRLGRLPVDTTANCLRRETERGGINLSAGLPKTSSGGNRTPSQDLGAERRG